MRPETTIRRVMLVASVAWMGVIFTLSAVPGSSLPPGKYGTFAHFAVYAVLGALLLLSLPRHDRPWATLAAAVAIASLYGVTDEFHQSFVAGRMPDVVDWMVDPAGALAATLVLVAARRVMARRQ